jgi:hypothetical protein
LKGNGEHKVGLPKMVEERGSTSKINFIVNWMSQSRKQNFKAKRRNKFSYSALFITHTKFKDWRKNLNISNVNKFRKRKFILT